MSEERFLHPLLPGHGRLNRPRVRQMTVPHAGPGPLLTALHQPGPYRIVQDRAEHREEMGVLLDGQTLEAALPDMAVTPVMPMVAPHVTGQPPLHEGTQGLVSHRLKHQVEMVGHQTQPEHLHGVFDLGRGEQVEEGAIVSLLVKHDGTAIAAIEGMIGVSSTLTAGNARHQDGTLRQVHRRRQEKSSLSPFPIQFKRKGGVTREDAAALDRWAKEYDVPFSGPEAHPGRGFGSKLHIRVGPKNHIPVK